MGLELLAAIVAAVAFAGIAMMLRKVTRDRLPRWIVPAAAGLGLIGFTAWSEYSWFARVSGELPEGVEVVWADDNPQALRPWTFAAPLVTRFLAMDSRTLARHPAKDDLVLAEVYAFARWRGVEQGLVVVDCAGMRSVRLAEGVRISEAGELEGGAWADLAEGDQLGVAGCRRSD